jgi:DNA-binding response OmpR family regulator
MTGTCVVPAGNERAVAQRTILLVEDDETLRRLIRLILKGSGFAVVEAGRGFEALALGRDYPGLIHLLVTDLVLPEVDGQRVADQVRNERPGVKVLFMSGATEEIAPRDGADNFLQKPFTPAAFLKAVNRLLEM